MNGVDVKSAGLCASCRHARRVTTPRSQFVLCERSRTDSSYERYPRLPVLACPGYEAGGLTDPSEGSSEAPPSDRG